MFHRKNIMMDVTEQANRSYFTSDKYEISDQRGEIAILLLNILPHMKIPLKVGELLDSCDVFIIYIRFITPSLMSTKLLLPILLLLALHAISLNITEKNPETAAISFKKFDKDKDGFLSKSETRQYFDKEYMLDFQGIDIDPKFIESSFNYIISCDQDKNGLDLNEFIEGIVPKENQHKKREPEYYPEQEL